MTGTYKNPFIVLYIYTVFFFFRITVLYSVKEAIVGLYPTIMTVGTGWLCLDGGDTELMTETLTGQSSHNLLFVDVLCQIMRDEQEHVCVHI